MTMMVTIHRLLRLLFIIVIIAVIFLIPMMAGALFSVPILWLSIWLEAVWFSLWMSRILAGLVPTPAGIVASLFTDSPSKWKGLIRQLQVSVALVLWSSASYSSLLPILSYYQAAKDSVQAWQFTMNRMLWVTVMASALNLAGKLIIQLVAINFHERIYQDRAALNEFFFANLAKLYTYSREVKLKDVDDSVFEDLNLDSSFNDQSLLDAIRTTIAEFSRQFRADFVGRAETSMSHPSRTLLTLMCTKSGAQLLARRLFRTFVREGTHLIHQEDLIPAFHDEEECATAFSMLDNANNGHLSAAQLEHICIQVAQEAKALQSMKPIPPILSHVDSVFSTVVVALTLLMVVTINVPLASTAAYLGGALALVVVVLGRAIHELVGGAVFVLIKHPFDEGDRVTLRGASHAHPGTDYFVEEMALLYTIFKRPEGQMVQISNTTINELMIINQRRSGALAEAIPMVFKFGTTIAQLATLREMLVEFVKEENDDFGDKVILEFRDIVECHSINVFVIFFYRSNWQNEPLRLQRRNKFIHAMADAIVKCHIEGPRMRYPGQKDSFPLYIQHVPGQQ